MKIAIMGLQCYDANKGCEALTYSFINIIKKNNTQLEINVFGYSGLGILPDVFPDISFRYHKLNLKNPIYLLKLKREFDYMDLIVDMTFGDGFSDIYGIKWNCITNIAKEVAIHSKTPFVLLPQTYGPYYNPVLKRWAYSIIQRSDYAFARDSIIANEINSVIGNKIVEATDLAFALYYDAAKYKLSKRKKLGINVSALLWFEGHKNTIKLSTDYKRYINEIVKWGLSNNYEVHLISHVIDDDFNSPENDNRACIDAKGYNEDIIIAPKFTNPIDAKSYIANMDIFVGARMHSTIGSFSSGVLTIPFAYSRKFEGLFNNLDYKYIIYGNEYDTDMSINKTIEYINSASILMEQQSKSIKIANKKIEFITDAFDKILSK